jgi:hypothetical protein
MKTPSSFPPLVLSHTQITSDKPMIRVVFPDDMRRAWARALQPTDATNGAHNGEDPAPLHWP